MGKKNKKKSKQNASVPTPQPKVPEPTPVSESESDEHVEQKSSFSAFGDLEDMTYESDMSSDQSESEDEQRPSGNSQWDFGDEDDDFDEDESEPEPEPEPEPETEPESESEPEPELELPPAHLKGKALKKWKKKQAAARAAAEEDDFDDILGDFDTPVEEKKTTAPVVEKPPPGLKGKALKKWKKKQAAKRKAAEQESLDDILGDLDDTPAAPAAKKEEVAETTAPDLVAEKPPPGLSKNQLKKWKKKQAAKRKAAEQSLGDVVGDLDSTPAAEQKAEVEEKEVKDETQEPAPVDITKPPPGLSKNALKKWKRKQRALAEAQAPAEKDTPTPADSKTEAEAKTEAEPADDGKPPPGLSKNQLKKWKAKQKKKRQDEAKKKKKGGVNVLRDRLRREKEEREALQREEEARLKREQEEEERKVAEEARIKEKKERKQAERLARRAEMKRKGLLLTKKQKQQRRLAEERLAQMRAAGIVIPEKGSGDGKRAWKPKRKNQRKQPKMTRNEREAEAIMQRLKEEEIKLKEEAEQRQKELEAEEAELMAGLSEEEKTEEEGSGSDVMDDWDVDSEEEQQDKEAKQKERADRRAAILEKRRKRDEEIARRLAAIEAEKEKQAALEAKKKKKADEKAKKKAEKERLKNLRSPICCILGHVDTGKTKILDYIRKTNVQEREAGGITQQIGATYFPVSAIKSKTELLRAQMKKQIEIKLPGLLIIDTPGHESFTNLRSRGSSLCDIAILVVDITHGLEPQTLESIGLLRARKTPFIVALNKIDRIYDWKSTKDHPIRMALADQIPDVVQRFDDKVTETIGLFAAQSLNTVLYWENKDHKKYVNLVPTSALTGEGIPDLLMLMTQLTQKMMAEKLAVKAELECTVLEVKEVNGLGMTIDVVIVNGELREGQTIVICGLKGPIVTTIRGLLTPHPMKESRVNGAFIRHKVVKAAMGVKVCAPGLEYAIAGGSLLVARDHSRIEELKDEVMYDLQTILQQVDSSGKGVYVVASTLGSLEALLQFLKDAKIPVAQISIGNVSKKDVIMASVMVDKAPEFATILAFDVKVSEEAKRQALKSGVRIFTADIIYHLFDQMTAYMKELLDAKRDETKHEAVFPCILEIMPQFIFNNKNPIVMGVRVVEGVLKLGTPLCCPSQNNLVIGYVESIEFQHEEKKQATLDQEVSIKVAPLSEVSVMYGRQFDHTDAVYSKISRRSINVLKENFKDEMTDDWWRLIMKMKRTFDIM